MPDVNWRLEITKILLDKGLLAAIAIWLGLRAAWLLEQFKSSAAWRNELAKERVAAAKRLSAASWIFWTDTLSLKRPRAESENDSAATRETRSKKWQEALIKFEAAASDTQLFLPLPIAPALKQLVLRGDSLRFKLMHGTSHDDELIAFGGQIDDLHSHLRFMIESPWAGEPANNHEHRWSRLTARWSRRWKVTH
jgi:hypothetical protein